MTDGVDVSFVKVDAVTGNGKLPVGGCCGTVSVREVVDDENAGIVTAAGVCSTNVCQGGVNQGDFGPRIPVAGLANKHTIPLGSTTKAAMNHLHPLKRRHVGDFGGRCGPGTAHGRDGEAHYLGPIVRVGPLIDTDKRVTSEGRAAGRRCDGGARRSAGRRGGGADGGGGGTRGSGRPGSGSWRIAAWEALAVVGVLGLASAAGSAASRAGPSLSATLAPGRMLVDENALADSRFNSPLSSAVLPLLERDGQG